VPSRSQAQQRLTAIALHSPSKVYARNRIVLGMSSSQLRDFAATKRTGLPQHVPPKRKKKRLSDVITRMKLKGSFGPRRPTMPLARNRVPGPTSYGMGE
jgi:hypothetical protein